MNVLVVDDSLYIREQMRSFFKNFSEIKLFEASCGEEAFDFLGGEKIDLMIVDSVMPAQSGISVIQKSQSLSPETIIFGLTTQERGATRNRLLEVGAKKVLKKPFSHNDLLKLLEGYI
jgi:DNA-binding response OmpR family regulator